MSEPSLALELRAEYFQLYKLAEGMHGILRDAGMDLCGGNCGGTCPLCVARRRFAPHKTPRIVTATVENMR